MQLGISIILGSSPISSHLHGALSSTYGILSFSLQTVKDREASIELSPNVYYIRDALVCVRFTRSLLVVITLIMIHSKYHAYFKLVVVDNLILPTHQFLHIPWTTDVPPTKPLSPFCCKPSNSVAGNFRLVWQLVT